MVIVVSQLSKPCNCRGRAEIQVQVYDSTCRAIFSDVQRIAFLSYSIRIHIFGGFKSCRCCCCFRVTRLVKPCCFEYLLDTTHDVDSVEAEFLHQRFLFAKSDPVFSLLLVSLCCQDRKEKRPYSACSFHLQRSIYHIMYNVLNSVSLLRIGSVI